MFKRKINDTKCWPYFVKYEFGYEAYMKAFVEQGVILRQSVLPTTA